MATISGVKFWSLPKEQSQSFSQTISKVRTALVNLKRLSSVFNIRQKAMLFGLSESIQDSIFDIYTEEQDLSLAYLSELINNINDLLNCFTVGIANSVMRNYNVVFQCYQELRSFQAWFIGYLDSEE